MWCHGIPGRVVKHRPIRLILGGIQVRIRNNVIKKLRVMCGLTDRAERNRVSERFDSDSSIMLRIDSPALATPHTNHKIDTRLGFDYSNRPVMPSPTY